MCICDNCPHKVAFIGGREREVACLASGRLTARDKPKKSCPDNIIETPIRLVIVAAQRVLAAQKHSEEAFVSECKKFANIIVEKYHGNDEEAFVKYNRSTLSLWRQVWELTFPNQTSSNPASNYWAILLTAWCRQCRTNRELQLEFFEQTLQLAQNFAVNMH